MEIRVALMCDLFWKHSSHVGETLVEAAQENLPRRQKKGKIVNSYGNDIVNY
jgi:hypothetical protein